MRKTQSFFIIDIQVKKYFKESNRQLDNFIADYIASLRFDLSRIDGIGRSTN